MPATSIDTSLSQPAPDPMRAARHVAGVGNVSGGVPPSCACTIPLGNAYVATVPIGPVSCISNQKWKFGPVSRNPVGERSAGFAVAESGARIRNAQRSQPVDGGELHVTSTRASDVNHVGSGGGGIGD